MCFKRLWFRLSSSFTRLFTTRPFSSNYEALLDTAEEELEPGLDYVNVGDEDQMELHGYRSNSFKRTFAWFLTLLTLGILRLMFFWYPAWHLRFTHSACAPEAATKVLLIKHCRKTHSESFISEVQVVCSEDGTEWHVFIGKEARYVWMPSLNCFQKLKGLEEGVYCAFLLQQKWLMPEEQKFRRNLYGNNLIEVDLPSFGRLFLSELLEPFAWFQFFALLLWTVEGYVYYCIIVFGMTIFSMLASVWQTRANKLQFKKKWEIDLPITLLTPNGIGIETSSKYLVPGDKVLIKEGYVPCDLALLNGSCIVQEQFLTDTENEVSMYKTSLPNRNDVLFDPKEHATNILLGGTLVTKIQDRTIGIVIRTGYMTAQGQIAASVLFARPVSSHLDKDAMIVVWLLATVSILAVFYTLIKHALDGEGMGSLALKALDLITICVPPALPAVISLGVFHAVKRLKLYGISCSDPQAINLAGAVDCVVFDKTGTLTEKELDFHTAVYCSTGIFSDDWRRNDELVLGMATSNDLMVLPGGRVSGDPLDMLVFQATGWKMTHFRASGQIAVCPSVSNPAQSYHRVLRRYPFSPALQRTGVLVFSQAADSIPACASSMLKLKFFCKGSCETVLPVTKFANDNLAKMWQEEANNYSRLGYRVLLLSGATIEIASNKMEKLLACGRETWEAKDLQPLGLLILKNKIKKSAQSVMHTLQAAKVRIVLATGDDVWTALHVAKECGIIKPGQPLTLVEAEVPANGQPSLVFKNMDSESKLLNLNSEAYPTTDEESFEDIFAPPQGFVSSTQPYLLLTGATWMILKQYFQHIMLQVALRGLIFARMRPHQKKELLCELQNLGFVVCMCGNAHSDLSSLKAAHVGLTIANLDVQTTAFTARSIHLNSVTCLLREGRAALVSSLGLFKFMAAYSLTQFTTVMMLYELETNLSDWQFLYIDFVIVTFIVFAFVRTRAFEGSLAPAPCLQSLLLVDALISVCLQMILIVCGQHFAYSFAQDQSWLLPTNSSFLRVDVDTTEMVHPAAFTNYAVWSVSVFQYLTLALTFSQGPPFRQRFYTNVTFVFVWITLLVISVYLLIAPHPVLVTWLGFELPPNFEFRFALLTLAFVSAMISLAVERFLAQGVLSQGARKLLRFFRPSVKNWDWSGAAEPNGQLKPPNVITCARQTKCPPPNMLSLHKQFRSNRALLSPKPSLSRITRVSLMPSSPPSSSANLLLQKLRRYLGAEKITVTKYQLAVEGTKVTPPSYVNELVLSPVLYNLMSSEMGTGPHHSQLYKSQTSRRK